MLAPNSPPPSDATPVTTAQPSTVLRSDRASVGRAGSALARRRQRLILGLRIAIVVVFTGGWEIAARTHVIDPFFFAMPSTIVAQLWTWIVDGTAQGPLWGEVAVTLEETVLGFVIGSILGIVFGIVLGRDKLLADVFSIFIKVANSIPRIVLGSIFVIALGLGMPSKVALAVVMVFFVVFANAFQGVREADRALITNARILGASSFQVTRHVIVPAAMSWILASLHVSFGFALVGAVVGEFLGSRHGIGLLISAEQGLFNPAGVFAAMIVLAIVALIADYLLTWVEHRLLKWRPPAFGDVST